MSLKDFLTDMATNFETGALECVATAMRTPTSIYFGDQLVLLKDSEAVLGFYETYRNNLIDLGFVRTDFEILDRINSEAARVQLNVRWRQLGNQGQQLSVFEGTYFCMRDSRDKWLISLIQFKSLKHPHLIGDAALL